MRPCLSHHKRLSPACLEAGRLLRLSVLAPSFSGERMQQPSPTDYLLTVRCGHLVHRGKTDCARCALESSVWEEPAPSYWSNSHIWVFGVSCSWTLMWSS